MRHGRSTSTASRLLLGLCLSSAGAAALSESSTLQTRDIDMASFYGAEYTALDYEFPLSVVVVEGSGWSMEEAVERVKGAARVLSQCKVAIGPARVKLVRTFAYLRKLSSPFDWQTIRLAKALGASDRPVVFFIDAVRGGVSSAFAARFSVMQGLALDPALKDSIWMTRNVKDTEQTRSFASYYFPQHDVLAHEIAHVLGDLGHIHPTERNLMHHSGGYLDNTLTYEQCRAIRTRTAYVHAIVRPHDPVAPSYTPAGLLPTKHAGRPE